MKEDRYLIVDDVDVMHENSIDPTSENLKKCEKAEARIRRRIGDILKACKIAPVQQKE